MVIMAAMESIFGSGRVTDYWLVRPTTERRWAAKTRMIARPGGKDNGLGGTHSKDDKKANKEKSLHRPAANASGMTTNSKKRHTTKDNNKVLTVLY